MKVYSDADYPQLSPSWWELRAGRPTSSDAKRIITAKDALPSKGWAGYAAELSADLKCSSPKYFTQKARPINRYQEYGRDMEEEARNWFAQSEHCEGYEVCKVGFITSDDGRFGASPDLMLKKDGIWVGGGEIKNYGAIKHAKYYLKGTLALEVKAQIHHCLAVTSLPFWFWVSYSPDLNPLVVKVFPDSFTAALKVQLEAFWEYYQTVKVKLGVGMSEPEKLDPEVEQAIAAWKEKLATGPGICTLNEWLRTELPELPKAAKLPIWNAVKEYGAKKGWSFDFTDKCWKEGAPAF